jgi:hypothetical protein
LTGTLHNKIQKNLQKLNSFISGEFERGRNVMHRTGIAGFSIPPAPRNLVAQVWQRKVGAELHAP